MTSRCPHRHVSYATWRLQVFTRLCAIGESDPIRIEPVLRRGIRTQRPRNQRPGVKPHGRKTSEVVPNGSETPPENNDKKSHETGTEHRSIWQPRGEQGREDLKDMIAELEAMLEQKNPEDIKRDKGKPYSVDSPVERRLTREKRSKKVPTRMDSDPRLAANPWANMLASSIRQCQATKARLPKDLMLTWGIMQNPANKLDYLLPVELSDINTLQKEMQTQFEQDLPRKSAKASQPKHREGSRIHIVPDRALTDAMSQAFMRKKGKSQEWSTSSSLLSGTLIPYTWRQKIDMAAAFKRTQKTIDPATGKVMPASDDQKENIPVFSDLQWQPDIHRRTQAIMNERLMVALEGIAERNLGRKGVSSRSILAMDLPNNGKMKCFDNKLAYDTEEVASKAERGPPKNTTQEPRPIHFWRPLNTTDIPLSPGSDQGAQSSQERQAPPNWQPIDTAPPKLEEALSALVTRASLDWAAPGKQKSDIASTSQETETQSTAFAKKFPSEMSMEPPLSIKPQLKQEVWPYGSIFLHIGSPKQYVGTIERWHALYPSNLPHHHLVPPTICINDTFRVPIFNILTLAGPRVAARLQALTHGYTVFDYAFWANFNQGLIDMAREKAALQGARPSPQIDQTSDITLEEEPLETPQYITYADDIDDEKAHAERQYMICIKGSMFKAPELIMEIWRLWRYIGGRRGLYLGDQLERKKKRSFKATSDADARTTG